MSKILHTMIRVLDLNKSIEFYEKAFGMSLVRKNDFPEGKFTLAFLAFDDRPDVTIELTHNWDQQEVYQHGNGFGHIALGVDDISKSCNEIKSLGYKVCREPGPMKHGTTVIAFVQDPDGYMIELIETK
jgi:lactoylglutathione lyase